jgi:uncharacterized protein YecT (DUF1311 family)
MAQCFADEEATLRALLSRDLANLRMVMSSASARADLDRAELAWENYMAADCGFVTQILAGGSQAAVDDAACRAEDTLQRVRSLQGDLVEACQGQPDRVECEGFRAAVP